MAVVERWYFTKEQLKNTPSRKCGIDADKELSYRQQAANFIQDMGQRLSVTQLCINTAIVYMHRFYMFHSFTKFHRHDVATCALFLAAKVEEQPRKLEHFVTVSHKCLFREDPPGPKSEVYLEKSAKLAQNENIMLQTLGFHVAIDHPHTHVVKCCQMVKGSYNAHSPSKDLAQTSYIMATNSLHLTTMCLQYKPTVVACMCIHLACKWSNWAIPQSSEGKEWFWYVDKSVTLELLEELTSDFLVILDKCPNRLRRKIMASHKSEIPEEDEALERKNKVEPSATVSSGSVLDQSPSSLSEYVPIVNEKREVHAKDNIFSNLDSLKVSPSVQPSTSSAQPVKKTTPLTYKEHKERKEREKILQGGSSVKTEPASASQGSSTFQPQQRISVPEKSVSEANRIKPLQLHPVTIKQETSRQPTQSLSSTSASKHHSATMKLSVNIERLATHSSPQGPTRPPSIEPNVNPDRQYIPQGNKNHHHSSNHDRHSSSSGGKHRSHEKHEHKVSSHEHKVSSHEHKVSSHEHKVASYDHNMLPNYERPNALSLSGGEPGLLMPKDRHAMAGHSSSGSSSSKNLTRPHSLTNSSSSLKRQHSPPLGAGQPAKHQRPDFNKSHKKTGVSSMLAGQSLLNLPMPPGETLPINTKSGDQEPPCLETDNRPSSCSTSPKIDANHFRQVNLDSQKGKSSYQPQIPTQHCKHMQPSDMLSQIQLPPSRQPPILQHQTQIPYTKPLPLLPIPGMGLFNFGLLSMAPPLPPHLRLPPPPPPPPIPGDPILPPLPPMPHTPPPPPPPE